MLGYFGPAGTFTHQALLSLNLPDDVRAYSSVGLTLDAVRHGDVRAGLVPIENSVEGGVSATIDSLASGQPLVIVAEVLLPVRFGLYARPGTDLAGVRRVITHPHAAAQVRDWLDANLPEAQVAEQGSTAGAAAEVARPESIFDAAICAAVAGQIYGLVGLVDDIADNSDAVTRFVLMARPASPPPATGHDKTTVIIHLDEDRPGGLIQALDQFASRGVNLCRIESRPEKDRMGNYFFSIDAEGHISDARVRETLMGLRRTCRDVVYLGSYPRADGVAASVASGTTDADFAAAAAWLDAIIG